MGPGYAGIRLLLEIQASGFRLISACIAGEDPIPAHFGSPFGASKSFPRQEVRVSPKGQDLGCFSQSRRPPRAAIVSHAALIRSCLTGFGLTAIAWPQATTTYQ